MTSVEEDRHAAVPHSSRRSWIRYLALLTVLTLLWIAGAVVLFGWDWLPQPAPFRTKAGPAGWRIFHEPKYDWTVEYPAAWHAQRIKESKRGSPYTYSQYGILISNIPRRFEHEKGPSGIWSPLFDLRGVPDTFVGIQVSWMYVGGFVVRCEQWGGPFPLSLEKAVTESSSIADARLEGRLLNFVARHEPLYFVRAWNGPRASAEDLGKLDRIVRSIKFDDAPKRFEPLSRNCFG